jgi:hypothetical protein
MYVVWLYVKDNKASKYYAGDNNVKPIKREFAEKALYDTYMMALSDAGNEVVEIITFEEHGKKDNG